MELSNTPMRPLARGYLAAMRNVAALQGAPIVAIGIGADAVLYALTGYAGAFTVLATLLAGWWLFVATPRRFGRWAYAFTGRELHVASGWLVRRHTIVPVGRVQHIDTRQGPVERRHDVATLIVHTAGTEHARVTVPGLERSEAEAIRDAIRGSIGIAAP